MKGRVLIALAIAVGVGVVGCSKPAQGPQPVVARAQPPVPAKSSAWPAAEDVKTAYVPGGPKLPNWPLTTEGLNHVLAMLQDAHLVNADDTPPPPSNGPAGPLTLVLELRSGESLSFRQAADCTTSTGADNSQRTTCTTAAGQVLVFRTGKYERWRAEALAGWLAGGWQSDVQK